MSLGHDWLRQWFFQALDDEAIESVKVLWGIWIHRNKATFQNELDDPGQMNFFVNSLGWTVGHNLNFDSLDQAPSTHQMGNVPEHIS